MSELQRDMQHARRPHGDGCIAAGNASLLRFYQVAVAVVHSGSAKTRIPIEKKRVLNESYAEVVSTRQQQNHQWYFPVLKGFGRFY